VYYCGVEHQRTHWTDGGHSRKCASLADLTLHDDVAARAFLAERHGAADGIKVARRFGGDDFEGDVGFGPTKIGRRDVDVFGSGGGEEDLDVLAAERRWDAYVATHEARMAAITTMTENVDASDAETLEGIGLVMRHNAVHFVETMRVNDLAPVSVAHADAVLANALDAFDAYATRGDLPKALEELAAGYNAATEDVVRAAFAAKGTSEEAVAAELAAHKARERDAAIDMLVSLTVEQMMRMVDEEVSLFEAGPQSSEEAEEDVDERESMSEGPGGGGHGGGGGAAAAAAAAAGDVNPAAGERSIIIMFIKHVIGALAKSIGAQAIEENAALRVYAEKLGIAVLEKLALIPTYALHVALGMLLTSLSVGLFYYATAGVGSWLLGQDALIDSALKTVTDVDAPIAEAAAANDLLYQFANQGNISNAAEVFRTQTKLTIVENRGHIVPVANFLADIGRDVLASMKRGDPDPTSEAVRAFDAQQKQIRELATSLSVNGSLGPPCVPTSPPVLPDVWRNFSVVIQSHLSGRSSRELEIIDKLGASLNQSRSAFSACVAGLQRVRGDLTLLKSGFEPIQALRAMSPMYFFVVDAVQRLLGPWAVATLNVVGLSHFMNAEQMLGQYFAGPTAAATTAAVGGGRVLTSLGTLFGLVRRPLELLASTEGRSRLAGVGLTTAATVGFFTSLYTNLASWTFIGLGLRAMSALTQGVIAGLRRWVVPALRRYFPHLDGTFRMIDGILGRSSAMVGSFSVALNVVTMLPAVAGAAATGAAAVAPAGLLAFGALRIAWDTGKEVIGILIVAHAVYSLFTEPAAESTLPLTTRGVLWLKRTALGTLWKLLQTTRLLWSGLARTSRFAVAHPYMFAGLVVALPSLVNSGGLLFLGRPLSTTDVVGAFGNWQRLLSTKVPEGVDCGFKALPDYTENRVGAVALLTTLATTAALYAGSRYAARVQQQQQQQQQAQPAAVAAPPVASAPQAAQVVVNADRGLQPMSKEEKQRIEAEKREQRKNAARIAAQNKK
jgi:hypothetical protein